MAGQLRVDEITDEAGTGSPSFPVGNVGIGTSSPSGALDVSGGFVHFRNPNAFTGGENFTRPDVIIAGANDTSGNVTRLCLQSQSGAQVFFDNTCGPTDGFSDLAIRLRTSSLGALTMPKVKEFIHNGVQRSVIPGGGTLYQETPSRAWVNFDGTVPSIRASVNVSSVTRNSTGDFTVNLNTAMPDANYSAVIATQRNNTGGVGFGGLFGDTSLTQTTTTIRLQFVNFQGALENPRAYCVSIFR